MADYYAILKRAISALPEPTGEARRAVYEKARTALVAQLKSFDPPLSASDITQQRLQLEDAIRKVESEAAKGLLTQALNRAAAPERANTASTAQPAPTAARAASPQPAATPSPSPTHAPSPAPSTTLSPSPVATPQPQTPRPTASVPVQPDRTPTGPTAPTGFSRPDRSDREPTGQNLVQPRPPLSSPEPTSATRPPLARPHFEPATRPAATLEPPTGNRAAPLPHPAEPAPAPPAAPPVFTRERATTGTTTGAATSPRAEMPAPPPYFEQEDVTQPVANRAFRSAVQDMDRLGTAAHESARRARDALAASDIPPTGNPALSNDGGRKGRRPLTAQSKPTGNVATPPPLNAPVVVPRKTSRWPIVVGLVVVAVVVLGGGGLYWKRDVIASYIGAHKPILDLVQRSASEKPFVKSTDRLLPDDNGQKSAQNPGVKVVTTQPITPGGDQPPSPPPAATPVPTPSPAQPPQQQIAQAPAAPTQQSQTPVPTTTAPATTAPGADVPPIAQKVTLLEEAADSNSPPVQSEGKVIWTLQKTPSTQAGKPDVVRLVGRVEVPNRSVAMTLTMEQNNDAGLQASHLIKLDFKLPADFDNKGVARVPGVILKPAEGARGDPLNGATAKITSNLFWIALYSADADRTRNIQLLKDRGWIDIPIVYETNKRAMLTLEKAGAGDRIFNDAFAAWGN